MRPLRARVWRPQAGNFPFSGAPATPDCVTGPLLTTSQIADLEDPTLMRIRGFLFPTITVAGASSTPVYVYVGIGVQNAQAVAAGALPCPYTNGDWGGWLYQAQFVMSTANPAIGAIANSPMNVVDGKGKRRLQEDDEIFGAVELLSRPADTEMNIHMALRFLLLNG